MPIIDLHCDLLCYLQGDPSRTPYDPQVRCAIPQLRQGGICLQVMAAFSETSDDSAKSGMRQVEIFHSLPEKYPEHFYIVNSANQLDEPANRSKVGIMLAFENGSAFCSEKESLEEGLRRLDHLGKVAYISMTWNLENRFGGGAHTDVGLKPDGKRLLDYLDGKKIAIDFSHASDRLIREALDYIDAGSLQIPVMASHSNFRVVTDAPRNLPDDLAVEIARRGGVIGFNFVRFFVGADDTKFFSNQLSHAFALGLQDHLCFGADFFYGNDVPIAFRKKPEELFFPGFDHAGCYGKVIDLWQQSGVTPQQIERISNANARRFLEQH